MLVEAAWVAVKTPGPLRAFYERVRARRGMQIAVVATARKLAVLCWHMIARGEDYAFARPSLTAKKLRALELQAGMPARRGQKGRAAGYSLKDVRAREKQIAEHAERAYRQLVADGRPPPRSQGWAWPPPMGRDSQGPQTGQQLRGRPQPQNLRFARGPTTPTTEANADRTPCRCPAALESFIRAGAPAALGREAQGHAHGVEVVGQTSRGRAEAAMLELVDERAESLLG